MPHDKKRTMRLLQDDRTSVRNVNRVELKRASDKALTLTVRALSPTYPEDAERELPSPVAPFRGEYIRDKRGRIEKDERGQPSMRWHPTPAFHAFSDRANDTAAGPKGADLSDVEMEMERERKARGVEKVGAGRSTGKRR